jgi:hypothetical protein
MRTPRGGIKVGQQCRFWRSTARIGRENTKETSRKHLANRLAE